MADTIKFKKGEVIFCEGDFEEYMYEILEGTVSIYANYKSDKQKLLTDVKEGSFFGEMGILEDAPRSATAVAASECVVKPYFANELDYYIKLHPDRSVELMQHISGRIRTLTKDYVDACCAIADYVKAEEAGEAKDEALITKMKAIAEVGKKSRKK